MLCKKCGRILVCQKCGGSVLPVSDIYAYCSKCAGFEKIPKKCTHCKKGVLSTKQPGIQKILLKIRTFYPDFAAGLISDGEKPDFSHDILIGTQHIVQYLEQISPGLLIFLNADTIAARSTFRSEEKFFLLAERIKRMMPGQERTVIIQTGNPGLDVYTDIARNNHENFYRRELSIREKLMFPPFGELIEMSFTGKNWQKNRNNVFEEMKQSGEIYEISSREKEDTVWWKILDRKTAFEILGTIIEKYKLKTFLLIQPLIFDNYQISTGIRQSTISQNR